MKAMMDLRFNKGTEYLDAWKILGIFPYLQSLSDKLFQTHYLITPTLKLPTVKISTQTNLFISIKITQKENICSALAATVYRSRTGPNTRRSTSDANSFFMATFHDFQFDDDLASVVLSKCFLDDLFKMIFYYTNIDYIV